MTSGTWIAELPRTLWLLAAVLVGLLHGSIREWASNRDPLDDYDVLLTDQRQFEGALVSERHGHRLFKDVTVYPLWLRDRSTGSKRLVHLVTGAYWDGRTSVQDGAVQARWDPAVFVAPVPYQPVGSTGLEQNTTVLDYLAGMRKARGVEFRYAWWWWARRPTFTSTAASVALIGVIAPTALNLLAFGRLTRPRREKRPSLWRVRLRRRASPPAAVAAVVTPVLPTPEPAAPAVAEAAPNPVAPLPPSDPLPAPTPVTGPEHHYGAKADDFYPTELRVAPPQHPKPDVDAGQHRSMRQNNVRDIPSSGGACPVGKNARAAAAPGL